MVSSEIAKLCFLHLILDCRTNNESFSDLFYILERNSKDCPESDIKSASGSFTNRLNDKKTQWTPRRTLCPSSLSRFVPTAFSNNLYYILTEQNNVMKVKATLLFLILSATICKAQPDFIKLIFPKETIHHPNIAYANDTLKKHLLDIYLPPNNKPNTPLIIWVHGGGWMTNDKYADMSYMQQTIKGIINKGYALASIDYRHSTTAIFPAQIQDCNQAVEFLYQNAAKYNLDRNRFALFGFSAGGHLASLMGLANNQNIPSFYASGKNPPSKSRR